MTDIYMGDINIENGGTWFELPDSDNWQQDYAIVLSVTDAQGCIGLVEADSLWLIESGSVHMPWDKAGDILSVIGAAMLPNGDIDDNGNILPADTQEHWLCFAYACQAYHGIDRYEESWVSDDSDCKSDDSFDVAIIERGTLADYIAAQWGKEVP